MTDEDRARREVHRVVTSSAEPLDETRSRRREDLDLVRLVRAHPETPRGVENDAIGSIEGAGRVVGRVDRRSVREDRQRPGASIGIDGDPEDPIVTGVCHAEVAPSRIERDAVRATPRYHAGDLTGSVDYADVAGEAGRVQGPAGVGGNAFGVVAVCGREIGEVLNDTLPERRRDDRLRRYESEYRGESDSPAAHLILPKSDPDRPREMLNPHERKHILGEALHFLTLRARLQQQQVNADPLQRAHLLGDLLRRPYEAGAEAAVGDAVVLERHRRLEL